MKKISNPKFITSYRAGKSVGWDYNSAEPCNQNDKLISSNLSKNKGLTYVLNNILNNRRFFLIRSVYSITESRSKNIVKILYMPRVKRQIIQYGSLLFRPMYISAIYSTGLNVESKELKKYINLRIDKKARIKESSYIRDFEINKWLSRRLFRGCNKIYINNKKLKFYNKTYNIKWNKFEKLFRKEKKDREFLWIKLYKNKFKDLKKEWKWNYKAVNYKKQKIFDRLLSKSISKHVKNNIKIRTMNIFEYLFKKNLMDPELHQQHFWSRGYKNIRYKYTSYFDSLNSFLIMCIIKNTEHVLLNIVSGIISRTKKVRKLMYILDRIIKRMWYIAKIYSCFRMVITGKLNGGTKRTKNMMIGFGVIPINSVQAECYNNFVNATHLFGEFGVKLMIMYK